MADPWYITTLQLVTHLPLLSAIVTSWYIRKKVITAGIIFILEIFILFWSPTYHICDNTGVCAFNAPVWVLQVTDNIFAFGGLDAILILLISTGIAYEMMRNDSVFWTLVCIFTVFGFIIAIVVSSITGPNMAVGSEKALLIISLTVCIAFLKLLYVDRGRTLIVTKFGDPLLLLAVVLTLLGVACFIIDIPGYEWLFHSFWHYFIFTALTFYQCSVVGHLPNVSDAIVKVDLVYD